MYAFAFVCVCVCTQFSETRVCVCVALRVHTTHTVTPGGFDAIDAYFRGHQRRRQIDHFAQRDATNVVHTRGALGSPATAIAGCRGVLITFWQNHKYGGDRADGVYVLKKQESRPRRARFAFRVIVLNPSACCWFMNSDADWAFWVRVICKHIQNDDNPFYQII